MNDYKDLIWRLRCNADLRAYFAHTTAENMIEYKAADAVEQLMKEYNKLDKTYDELLMECHTVRKQRDAAVADLRRFANGRKEKSY